MNDLESALDAPLTGVHVLDLTTGPMEVLSRLLTDLGAHVTRARVRGITRDVELGPVVDGVAIGSAIAALGTVSSSIDPADPAGAAAWAELLADTDILIEDTIPASSEEQALDVQGIRGQHPGIVVLSISGFGRDNRFAGWALTSPVAHALSSELSRSGIPGREPLLPPGELPYDVAAAQAALEAVSVYLDRLRTGVGARIDFSVLEGAMQALDPPFGMTGSAAAGVAPSAAPRGRAEERFKYPILPCSDGFVRICVLAPRQWRGMFEWMGRPEEFAGPEWDIIWTRFSSTTLLPAIAAFFADKTREDLEVAGQLHGVPTAAVLELDEAMATDQIIAREFFRAEALLPDASVAVPAGILEIDGVRAVQHEAPVAASRPVAAPILGSRPRTAARLPLDGIRVLDLGVIVVGGDTGRLLGDLGADVIKIENSAFIDGSRSAQGAGAMTAGFAAGHRNKRSIGINLRDPRGMEVVHDLVRRSDIVLTNFKPGVMQSLGLDFEALKAYNPGIVVIDSSAFGPTGPWSRRLGYGPLVRAAAGFTAQWTYPGEPESFSDAVTVYPDHVCARIGALTALALLLRRERTGLGGSASIAQSEVMLSHMAGKIAAEALERDGHRVAEPVHDAPWGVFPTAGDDDWLVVTVQSQQDWTALCAAMRRDDLLQDPSLRTASDRDRQRERIDAAVRDWLRGIPVTEAMETLQAAGVPAGAMLRPIDMLDWEFFIGRRAFRQEQHPQMSEPVVLEDVQIHSASVDAPPTVQAPLLGEQTAEVCAELLGMDAAAIAELMEEGVLESAVPSMAMGG